MTSHWDIRFLELAKLVSTWSKDPSTQVGAVIVRQNKTIASVGFNGFPMNMDDAAELYADRDYKLSRIIHAEMNALIFRTESIAGCTLYTYPFMTCDRCFAHMSQSGIVRIVAPIATQAQLERWGSAFEKVRQDARDAKVELIEVEFK